MNDFTDAFDFKENIERVTVDISKSHIWDISSVAALDSVISKFRRQGVEVEVIGLNRASATLVDHISLHDHGGAIVGKVFAVTKP